MRGSSLFRTSNARADVFRSPGFSLSGAARAWRTLRAQAAFRGPFPPAPADEPRKRSRRRAFFRTAAR